MKFSKYIIWTDSTMINVCFQLFRQNLSLLNQVWNWKFQTTDFCCKPFHQRSNHKQFHA